MRNDTNDVKMDGEGEDVQLFARPSAKDLERRQRQKKRQQQDDAHRQQHEHGGGKRARSAADVGGGGGAGAAPAGTTAAISSPLRAAFAPASAATGDADSFEQLGVSSWLCSVLRTLGITRPTPVQAACVPAVLCGRDAVGLAQTGSGKTACFALPVLQALAREGPYGVFCLVLTPTRELAFQLADQFRAFGAGSGLRDAVVVGGLDGRAQAAELARRPHVVVATPGRLAELLRQPGGGSGGGGGGVSSSASSSSSSSSLAAGFARVRFLVLDEADRLLDASFEDALRVIVAALPKAAGAAAAPGGRPRRQTLLFSATATRSLLRLQEAAMPDALVFSAYEAERRAAAAMAQKKAKKGGNDVEAPQEGDEGDDDDDDDDDEGGGGDGGAGANLPPPPSLAALAALDADALVRLPERLRQEYAFVPQRVKDVYLVHVLESWLGVGPAAQLLQQQAAAAAASPSGRRRAGGGKSGGKSGGAASVSSPSSSFLPGGGPGRSAIVFVGTCRGCRLLELLAGELGLQAAALHARKPQRQRLAALAAFRSGAVRLLVATDVAARGLDVPSVGLVVNYDLPALPSDYVHRVGRTARAGREGRALSLVCPADVSRLQAVEALTGSRLAEATELAGADAEAEAMRGITRVFGARRAALMALAEEDDGMAETMERRRVGWERGLSGEGGQRGEGHAKGRRRRRR